MHAAGRLYFLMRPCIVGVVALCPTLTLITNPNQPVPSASGGAWWYCTLPPASDSQHTDYCTGLPRAHPLFLTQHLPQNLTLILPKPNP